MMDAQARKTHAAVHGKGSALQRYMDVILGERSVWKLIYFEFCQWLAPIPGALGLFLRKFFWKRLFKECGKGTMFGTGVKLMHPGRIRIGSRVIISDNCVLDGRSPDEPVAIEIGDDVTLSHGVVIACKGGKMQIGARTGIGAYCMVHSAKNEPVAIGEDTIFGPYCYITGGSNYRHDRLDIPIAKQGKIILGGTKIGQGAWFGAGACALGGMDVGEGSIVGAGAHVVKSLPAYSISVGTPAKVVKYREGAEPAKEEHDCTH